MTLNNEKLSIVIITLNEEKTIGRLLKNLENQSFQNFETIVVDSNSVDNTEKVAKENAQKLKKFTFHKMKKRGASLGRNTGAGLASNERILFLDSDVKFENDFLEKTLNHLQKKKIDIASCYIKQDNFKFIYFLGYALINIGFYLTQFFSPTAVGACIFSTKTIHKKISGFDEEIYLCEDADYVNRASQFGKFKMLPIFFVFDNRRMEQDGVWKTVYKYFKANFIRFFLRRELKKDTCEIEYEFGHYNKKK